MQRRSRPNLPARLSSTSRSTWLKAKSSRPSKGWCCSSGRWTEPAWAVRKTTATPRKLKTTERSPPPISPSSSLLSEAASKRGLCLPRKTRIFPNSQQALIQGKEQPLRPRLQRKGPALLWWTSIRTIDRSLRTPTSWLSSKGKWRNRKTSKPSLPKLYKHIAKQQCPRTKLSTIMEINFFFRPAQKGVAECSILILLENMKKYARKCSNRRERPSTLPCIGKFKLSTSPSLSLNKK